MSRTLVREPPECATDQRSGHTVIGPDACPDDPSWNDPTFQSEVAHLLEPLIRNYLWHWLHIIDIDEFTNLNESLEEELEELVWCYCEDATQYLRWIAINAERTRGFWVLNLERINDTFFDMRRDRALDRKWLRDAARINSLDDWL